MCIAPFQIELSAFCYQEYYPNHTVQTVSGHVRKRKNAACLHCVDILSLSCNIWCHTLVIALIVHHGCLTCMCTVYPVYVQQQNCNVTSIFPSIITCIHVHLLTKLIYHLVINYLWLNNLLLWALCAHIICLHYFFHFARVDFYNLAHRWRALDLSF